MIISSMQQHSNYRFIISCPTQKFDLAPNYELQSILLQHQGNHNRVVPLITSDILASYLNYKNMFSVTPSISTYIQRKETQNDRNNLIRFTSQLNIKLLNGVKCTHSPINQVKTYQYEYQHMFRLQTKTIPVLQLKLQ